MCNASYCVLLAFGARLLWRSYAPLLYQTMESFRMPDGARCLFKKFCLHCAIFCTVISVLHSTFESWIWKFVYLISSALKVGIGHDLRSACVCQKLKTRTEMQRSSCIYASQTAHYLFQEHTCPTELTESIMQTPKLLQYNPESCDGNICIHWWWYKRNAYNGGPARRGRRLA